MFYILANLFHVWLNRKQLLRSVCGGKMSRGSGKLPVSLSEHWVRKAKDSLGSYKQHRACMTPAAKGLMGRTNTAATFYNLFTFAPKFLWLFFREVDLRLAPNKPFPAAHWCLSLCCVLGRRARLRLQIRWASQALFAKGSSSAPSQDTVWWPVQAAAWALCPQVSPWGPIQPGCGQPSGLNLTLVARKQFWGLIWADVSWWVRPIWWYMSSFLPPIWFGS